LKAQDRDNTKESGLTIPGPKDYITAYGLLFMDYYTNVDVVEVLLKMDSNSKLLAAPPP